ESVLPLRIMAFCLLFTYLYSATQAALDASRNEGGSAVVWLVATVANVVVDFVVIPRYGYVGSSVATLLSEIMVFAGGWLVLRRNLSLGMQVSLLARIGGVAALSVLVVFPLEKTHLLLFGAVAALVYLVLVLVSGLLRPSEVRLLFARRE
ncbi:MAG: polysaccharide biosynthesis C-terminal domain-containing protein, partial [Pseudomonadota bacterium]